MGHTWGTKLFFLEHSWGTVGAKSYLGHTWGTLGAEAVGAQLGHTWGTLGAQLRQKSELKHSFCKLNTLGAHLGHKVTWGTLGASVKDPFLWNIMPR